MRMLITLFVLLILSSCSNKSKIVFLEAESFAEKGGWVVDQQFMDVMGSPYLMANGIGKFVEDAMTSVDIPSSGDYRIFVRTKNWTAPFTDYPTPGIFKIHIDDKEVPNIFGKGSGSWHWENGGIVSLDKGKSVIILKDMTGFNGRIDAILFSPDLNYYPPDSINELKTLRKKWLGLSDQSVVYDQFDLVVVGGGIAGISASVSAARLGLKVALVHNRPVLGGNNSSEIRVWRSGITQTGKYPALGKIVNAMGPDKSESIYTGKSFGDNAKLSLVMAEKNISLFLNYHVNSSEVADNKIISVKAVNIENSSDLVLKAPLFADCTGDANLGFLAGADYREGSELKSQTGESRAPENDSDQVLGSSIFWWSGDTGSECKFPECPWAFNITEESCQHALQSAWNWESGFSKNMIFDFEEIRDNHLRAIFGNWDFQKNKSLRKNEYANYEIAELGHIMGKRESRRMLGDVIITQHDLDNQAKYPDGCVEINWGIDIHVPDPLISKYFPGEEFKAIAIHLDKEKAPPFLVPYRCFYSRNISNLFMAGRHISTTHVAHAATRVQRYTGTYGEVVGLAASLCKKLDTTPRGLYESHLEELNEALTKGVPDQSSDN